MLCNYYPGVGPKQVLPVEVGKDYTRIGPMGSRHRNSSKPMRKDRDRIWLDFRGDSSY